MNRLVIIQALWRPLKPFFDHLLRENPVGEAHKEALRLDFDRRLKLEFHGTKVTSDGGLLAYRELDSVFGSLSGSRIGHVSDEAT
jgi:hypothetical protein